MCSLPPSVPPFLPAPVPPWPGRQDRQAQVNFAYTCSRCKRNGGMKGGRSYGFLKSRHTAWLDLIVPSVFFFGAGFVWLTATLSLHTAIDIRRVTVLEHENITDPLIGIYNRRYLDRRLQEEFIRARRYSLPLSVLLLDIDHFKRVNDAYGHQVGDLVLSYLGKLLLSAIRATDIIARYGGEEILIRSEHNCVFSRHIGRTDTPTRGNPRTGVDERT